jgi:DNA-binding IclR family transcriptional regulator
VNRLLRTLGHLGFVRQDARRKYLVGPSIHVLSAQALFGSGLLRAALPALEALGRHQLIVALGVLWRDQVAYLYHALPGMRVSEALGRVGLYPATRSGIGMPLLASLPDAEVSALYRSVDAIPGYGRDRARLREDLRAVRRQGYAYVLQDEARGIWSLGLAVGAPPFAALAFSGRIDATRIPGLVTALREAAETIRTHEGETHAP